MWSSHWCLVASAQFYPTTAHATNFARCQKGATDVEVIGVDRDRDSALEAGKRLKSFPNFRHVLSNFGDLTVEQLGGQVDFVLADFGVSSHQIDDTSRGFRYGGADGDNAGPLDMRMGRDEGPSAADVVNEGSEEELVEILMKYGGEVRSDSTCAAS